MKSKLILSALIFSLLFSACKSKNKVLINTSTVAGTGKKQVSTDLLSTVEGSYFEVSLMSVGKGNYFIAQKELVRPSIGKEFKMVSFSIVDKDKKTIRFNNSTDFLNYMADAGYHLKDQKVSEYRTDYTFERK